MTSQLPMQDVMVAMCFDVCMILTGLASTMSPRLQWRVALALLSFGSFGMVLLHMGKLVLGSSAMSRDSHTHASFNVMLLLTTVVWMLYPLVWLAIEADIISPSAEVMVWFVLEYAAKAMFMSQLWQTNIKTLDERRQQVLEAWENANRSMVVRQLNHLVASKQAMLHMISTELMAPLMGILSTTSGLMRASSAARGRRGSSGRTDNELARIRSYATCVVNLVAGVLDTSRGVGGTGAEVVGGGGSGDGATPVPRAVRLPLVVGNVMRQMMPLVNEEVQLRMEMPDTLPLVGGSHARVSYIFFNLIGYAAKFTHNGHISAKASQDNEGNVRVQISDTGVGRPVGQLSRIFSKDDAGPNNGEVSVAGATQGALPDGTALGLYLVKQALASLGSAVDISRDDKNGAVLAFTLRAALPGAPEDEGEVPLGGTNGEGSGGGMQASTAWLAGGDNRICDNLNGRSDAHTGMSAPLPRLASVDTGSAAGCSATEAVAGSTAAAPGLPAGTNSMEKRRSVSIDAGQLRSSPAAGVNKPPHRLQLGASGMQKLLVLSVDDDRINQVVAEQVLRKEGWDVVKAFDGRQALNYIEDKADALPDVILLDIMMPNMNGYEMLEALRKTYTSAVLPVIMVSAKTREEDAVQALRTGADDYMTKPFKRNELVERIKAHVRSRDMSDIRSLATLAGGCRVLDLQMMHSVDGQQDIAGMIASSEIADLLNSADVITDLLPESDMGAATQMHEGYMAIISVRLFGLERHLAAGATAPPALKSTRGSAAGLPTLSEVDEMDSADRIFDSMDTKLQKVLDANASGSSGGASGGSTGSARFASARTHELLHAVAAAKSALLRALFTNAYGTAGAPARGHEAGSGATQLSRDGFAVVLPLPPPSAAASGANEQGATLLAALAGLNMKSSELRWPDGSSMLLQIAATCCPTRIMQQPVQHSPAGFGADAAALRTQQHTPWPSVLLLSPSPEACLALANCAPAGCMILSDAAHTEQARASNALRCVPWEVPLPSAIGNSSCVLRLYLAEVGNHKKAIALGPTDSHRRAGAAAIALGLLPPPQQGSSNGSGGSGSWMLNMLSLPTLRPRGRTSEDGTSLPRASAAAPSDAAADSSMCGGRSGMPRSMSGSSLANAAGWAGQLGTLCANAAAPASGPAAETASRSVLCGGSGTATADSERLSAQLAASRELVEELRASLSRERRRCDDLMAASLSSATQGVIQQLFAEANAIHTELGVAMAVMRAGGSAPGMSAASLGSSPGLTAMAPAFDSCPNPESFASDALLGITGGMEEATTIAQAPRVATQNASVQGASVVQNVHSPTASPTRNTLDMSGAAGSNDRCSGNSWYHKQW